MKSLQFNDGRPVAGETPLHRAAAYAELETIRLLLDAGADKTRKDADGETPLDWATQNGREAAILDLLR